MTKGKGDYEVGYGKPPEHTRWRKGQSGNPRGREKGHKGLKTDLETALNTINTVENKLTGTKHKGRNQRLAIDRLVERAALGDLKAQALLFPMIMQVLGAEDRRTGPKKLSATDQAILAEVLGERLANAGDEEPETEAGGSGNHKLPPLDAGAADDGFDDENRNGEEEDGDEDAEDEEHGR